jgi:siroheme synthase
MAARTIDAVTAQLVAAGMPAGTPAVAVENASRPGEHRIIATLGTLPAALRAGNGGGPTLVLIGAVVALARAESAEAVCAA